MKQEKGWKFTKVDSPRLKDTVYRSRIDGKIYKIMRIISRRLMQKECRDALFFTRHDMLVIQKKLVQAGLVRLLDYYAERCIL